ncbi:MAG: signal peptidase I, partial [Thermoleophilia bacterium]|nr:signal peptidase I [Thermoleophilia bacterium]
MGSTTRNDTPGGEARHTPAAPAPAVRRGWLRALRSSRRISFAARVIAWSALTLVVVVLGAASLIPRLSDNRALAVTARSMTETMPIGSAAIVAPIDATDVRVGDVISFDHPGASTEIVSHRVIEVPQVKARTVFRTQGDHNPKADDWKVDYVGQRGWKVVA